MALVPGNPFKYWSPDIARENSISDYMRFKDSVSGRDYQVDPLPKYDYAAQAAKYNNQAANSFAQGITNSISSNPFGGGLGGGRLGAVLRALRQQESGGNYGAINSSSGAMGAYQIMPFNILGSGGWDMEALNRNVSREQFLNNARIQNAIARYKFGIYMRQYGIKGALAAWYSGQPNWQNDSPQSGGPSIHDYVMQVLSLM